MEALKKSPFSYQQQFVFTMLMLDPTDPSIPEIQTPDWVVQLGYDLKNLFKQDKLTKMYFNDEGIVCIE